MKERKCWIVMMTHRNWGEIVHGVYLNESAARGGLHAMANEQERLTIERFGGCDREEGDTWISLGDTGTVVLLDAVLR